jgi:hypothetical protein
LFVSYWIANIVIFSELCKLLAEMSYLVRRLAGRLHKFGDIGQKSLKNLWGGE